MWNDVVIIAKTKCKTPHRPGFEPSTFTSVDAALTSAPCVHAVFSELSSLGDGRPSLQVSQRYRIAFICDGFWTLSRVNLHQSKNS